MKKLPKEIFVRWENIEDGDPWLMAGSGVDSLMEPPPDEKEIGVYRLVKLVSAKTNIQLTTIDK